MSEAEDYNKTRLQDKDQNNEFEYPFPGSLHLDPISINNESVKFSKKNRYDFDRVDKLKHPNGAPLKSKTNYEQYYKSQD